MVEKRRTESALTGRPLRERVLGQTRQLAGIVESLAPSREEQGQGDLDRQHLGRDNEVHDLEPDVSSSLETIHQVTETYTRLLDKLSAYELKVRDLTRKLSEETRTTGDALRAAAAAERIAREAQASAARAEEEASHSAGTVRELEHQLAALRSQTAKLMDAVDQLFPDLDEPASETRGLRVVR